VATNYTEASWLRRTWERVATVLAVIGLIDVSSQLIHWAALIHWVVTNYAIVRTWLFGWLPFHIHLEWHDPIVLFLIFLSVTNVGYYRRTGHTIVEVLRLLTRLLIEEDRYALIIVIMCALPAPIIYILIDHSLMFNVTFGVSVVIGALFAPVYLLLTMALLGSAIEAWRWLLVTAAIFGSLVAINQVYVLYLEPLPH